MSEKDKFISSKRNIVLIEEKGKFPIVDQLDILGMTQEERIKKLTSVY